MVSSLGGSFFVSESIKDKIDMSQFESQLDNEKIVEPSNSLFLDLPCGSQVQADFLEAKSYSGDETITAICWNPEDIKKVMSSDQAKYSIVLNGCEIFSRKSKIIAHSIRVVDGVYLLNVTFSRIDNI